MADIRSSLFGRLALETKLISLEQIQECLNLQVEYEKAGKKVPRLGELLAAKGYLTPDQVRDILRRQRESSTPQADLPPPPDPVKQVAKEQSSSVAASSDSEATPDAFGSFQIVKRLGCDASGYTYKAKYVPKDLTVILRVLSKEKMEDNPEYVRNFEEQVKKATDLKHPCIQRVVAAGRQHGRDYYAAQFFDGISLKRVLEARGKLDIPFALDIAVQLAKALEYGHARGVYHTEIRPSNILITPERKPMLVAYGVAHDVLGNLQKLSENAAETPFYVAPEQAIKEGGKCDARTDIYCLGAVLYHTITGQPPFKGDSVQEVLLSLAEEDVADPTLLNPEINQDLSNIVLSMMNPEPDKRYQTTTHLLQDLEACAAGYAGAPGKGPFAKRKASTDIRSSVMADTRRSKDDTTLNRARRAPAPGTSRHPHTTGGGHGAPRDRAERGEGRRGRSKHGGEDKTMVMMIVAVVVLVIAALGIIIVAAKGDKNDRPPPPQQPVYTPPQQTQATPPQSTQPAPAPQPSPQRPEPEPAPAPEPVATVPQPAPTPQPAPAPEPDNANGGDDEPGGSVEQPPKRGLFGLEIRE